MDKPSHNFVMIRGLAREARHWGAFPDRLQDQFPDSNIYCPDLPGLGKMQDEKPRSEMREIMECLRGQVLKNTGGPLTLVAVSLGGMAALEWIANYPKEIEKAFIINSSSSLSPVTSRIRWEIWKPFAEAIGTRDARASEERVLDLVSNSESVRHAALPQWSQIRRDTSVGLRTVFAQLMAARNFQLPEKSKAFEKVHFVLSLGDRLVEPRCTVDLARHFGAPVSKNSWAGHDLPLDDPSWLSNLIKSELSEPAKVPGSPSEAAKKI